MTHPLRVAAIGAATIATLLLTACAAPTTEGEGATGEDQTTFTIASGADNPLEGGVLTFIKDEVAADYGITIETRELADSRVLSEALNAGEIDGHVAVHAPFLDLLLSGEPTWDLAVASPIYSSLVSLASTKHASLDELPQGAVIAIPDDPVNGPVALSVLQDEGIIGFDASLDPVSYTVDDIVDNPKSVTFLPAGAAQLARSVEDVDLAFLPTSFMRASGYGEEVELLTRPIPEDYAIALVVRGSDVDSAAYAKLIEAFQDPRVADFVDEEYGDIAIGVRF